MSTDDNDEDEPSVGLPPLPSQVAQKAVEEKAAAQQQQMMGAAASASSSSSAVDEETTSYPIDLPSPILLALSMILAISSTGKKKRGKGGGGRLLKCGFNYTHNISVTLHHLSFLLAANKTFWLPSSFYLSELFDV